VEGWWLPEAVSGGGDQVPQRGHALHVEDPPTGERNVDTGGEVIFRRIGEPIWRMISSIQDPFRCPCEPINVAPSGRLDPAA
jgi:hypothetical protein